MKEIIEINQPSDAPFLEKESIETNLKVGNWFWVLGEKRWLGCAVKVGSNFIEICGPSNGRSNPCVRVLLSEVHESLEFEPNHEVEIRKLREHYMREGDKKLEQIKDLTLSLGVSLQPSLMNNISSGNELMVMSGAVDVDAHKKALIDAKETELPTLFKELETINGEITRWMSAGSLSLEAVMDEMKNSLSVLDDRIFNVSLYAGLAEDVVLCSGGKAASINEKLRVMQRKKYMDEEALLRWKEGGMEFKDIGEYDAWISIPENRDRILPFERCVVAMQVRRYKKERHMPENFLEALIKMGLEIADEFTYLYIRNGERVSRVTTELQFEEFIFPDIPDSTKPLMVRVFCGKLREAITRDDFEVRLEEKRKFKLLKDQWCKENPREQWEKENPRRNYEWENPYYSHLRDFDENEWKPLDYSNIYYDECKAEIDKSIKNYNKVALLIQGLMDRSDAFHPHRPVKTWEPESFNESIELVYDGSRVLNNGEAPSFEAYRDKCNSEFTPGSFSVGQEDYWEMKMAEKLNNRLDGNWRMRDAYRPTRYRPDGDCGMGFIAQVTKWNAKKKVAEFKWTRKRIKSRGRFFEKEYLESKILVPSEHLFNVSAYKKGDYLQFYSDPRTRSEYLKWAPLLLAAEDFSRQNQI